MYRYNYRRDRKNTQESDFGKIQDRFSISRDNMS